MDPQKDFIHIDGLFKQLHNGEEPERSGSWLHMKELLDKEMPVGTAISGGRSFRRYIVPLVAAILLVGGGIGYHELSKDKTTFSPLAAGNKTTGSNPAGGDAAHNLVATGSDKKLPEEKGSRLDGANVAGQQGQDNEEMSTPQHVSGTTGAGIAARPGTAAAGNNQSATAGTSGSVAGQGRNHQNASSRNSGGAQAQKNANTIAEPGVIAGGHIEEERVIEELKPGNAKHTTVITPVSNSADQAANGKDKDMKQMALSMNNKKIVRDPKGTLYKEERDTFKRIDLVERIVAGSSSNVNGRRTPAKTVLDTVAITRIEKVRYVPLNRMELAGLRKMSIEEHRKAIPVTNPHERILSREEVSLVPLTHYKVASKKVDPSKFNQLVQNTSAGISNYFDGSRNFYAAILVGGNASFGNPGAFGMQFGIAGLYSLSERLTLAAELKYVNHYFSNYSLEDKSVTFENVSSQQLSGVEWLFSGTQNTLTSAYKVNSFGALEMPVTLSYNLGRVSIFGGLNMAYAFPIKWTKENTYNTTAVQQTRNENRNPFLNSSFKVDEQQDFASRLGLGYVWGLNYDISRKVSLDARVAQILWDNNKGNTDAISRLFRIPTMQFSLGYYFGRKEKVIYIMDKR